MKRDLPIALLTVAAMCFVLFLSLAYDAKTPQKSTGFCRKDSVWVMQTRICP